MIQRGPASLCTKKNILAANMNTSISIVNGTSTRAGWVASYGKEREESDFSSQDVSGTMICSKRCSMMNSKAVSDNIVI
jgi:hypothetical protein